MNADDRRNLNAVSLLWAGPELASEIAAAHARLFPEAWDTASVTKLLDHPGSTALVARTGFPKTTIGFALAQIAADEAEILSLGVVPDWQRLGLAKRLVKGLEPSLSRAKIGKLFLEVAEDNNAARALYRSCGFQDTGRRKAYYARHAGPAVDAILMSKPIA